jgi:DNA modification methylase
VNYLAEKEDKSAKIKHIDHAISPQAHTPMYLMHKYWARKPHNVVGEYIEHYSKKGEIVLDPFVGSGVTAIEALKLGRKAIAIDLDPISIFVTRLTLAPVDIDDLKKAFCRIENVAKKKIELLYQTTCPFCKKKATITHAIWSDVVECKGCKEKIVVVDENYKIRDKCNCGENIDMENVVGEQLLEIGYECSLCIKKAKKTVRFLTKKPDSDDCRLISEISETPIPFWVPSDAELKYDNGKLFQEGTHRTDIVKVTDLFTRRNLIALSMLYQAIEELENSIEKDLMKLAFSGNLHNVSKLNVVHHLRLRSGVHPSRGWVMHRYWVPPVRIELPVWFYFVERFKHVLNGKTESNSVIPVYKEANSYASLEDSRSNALVISHSALELDDVLPSESVDYVFTDPPYGGSIQYLELSALWISWLRGEKKDPRFELRFGDEITINEAQQKGFGYYHKMLKASFEQIYDVLKSGRWLTVTFHNTDIKIYNSIIKAAVLAGFDLEKIIYQSPAVVSPKALLQPYGSAIGDYYIRFRKPEKKEKLLSDAEIDKERYERIVVDTVKHIIAERRESVTYSTVINSYPTIFAELKRNGYSFSAPEGIEEVLRKHLGKEFILEDVRDEKGKVIGKKWWLKEKLFLDRASLSERVEATIIGVLNRRVVVSFDDILEEIFTKFQNALTPDTQSIKSILEEYAEKTDGKWQLKKEMRLRQTQHNQIIEWLADIGKKMGFEVYADVPEHRGTKLNLLLSKEKIDRIREIDALWLKGSEIVYEFEVENSTGISDAIIRGSNIPSTDVKRFIVIPEERKNLLSMKIAEPILKENIEQYKWNFIFYDTFISFYEKSRQRKTIEASEIDRLANLSTRLRHEQQTLGQFTNRSELEKED